jgi:hypothetical protein
MYYRGRISDNYSRKHMGIFTKNRKLTPSWQLLEQSYKLVREHFTPILYLYLLPSLALTLGSLLLGDYDFESDPTSRESAGSIIILGSLVWSLLATPGFIYMQTEAVKGRAVGALKAYRKALPRLGSLVGMSMLLVAAVIILLIALLIPVSMNIQNLDEAGQIKAISVASLVILGLLLVIGLRYFGLAPYYAVSESAGPIESLRLSVERTRDISAYIWGTIGVIMVFALPGIILSAKYPGIGDIISTLLVLPFLFAFVLRWKEAAPQTKPAKKK